MRARAPVRAPAGTETRRGGEVWLMGITMMVSWHRRSKPVTSARSGRTMEMTSVTPDADPDSDQALTRLQPRPPMPSPTDLSEKIYRIALRRFRTHGFDETPVSAITREADVAKGTFFNHFPSKEHLLARVLDEMLDEAIAEGPSRPGGAEAIPVGLDRLALELAGHPHLARAIVSRLGALPASWRRSRTDEESVPGLERLRRWIRDRLAESLRISVPLEEVDDQTLSLLVVAAFEATLREWNTATGGEPPFPRRLLHGRISYLLVSAGFPRPVMQG